MRLQFVLPGFHRVHRGAEVALESVADQLAGRGHDVLVIGGGPPDDSRNYRYRSVRLIDRRHLKRLPTGPFFRTDASYEELTFVLGLLGRRDLADTDVTVTCGFPFVNWALTRFPLRSSIPPHVFVTQNGDAPATSDRSEFRFFRCDGLVCTNPIYEERNATAWRTALIPNGVDPVASRPGKGRRADFGIPEGVPVVLIVSALIESKRVLDGVRAVAPIEDAFLVIAGDGPERAAVEAECERLLPGRHLRTTVPASEMADLYRSADSLLHMSMQESFGNIYIEAMCCGIPVVAHDLPVTRWIFGEYCGLVDTTDLAAAEAAVRASLHDGRSWAEELAGPARTRFSWSSVTDLYEAFLADVVAGALGRRG